MIPENIKILIVNIVFNLKEHTGALWRISGQMPPIGLYSLEATFPDNVKVVSVEIEKILEFLETMKAEQPNVILIKATSLIDASSLVKLVKLLKTSNSQLKIGLVGNCEQGIQGFDITCYGTGLVLIRDIIKKVPINGFINTFNEDIKHELTIISKIPSFNTLTFVSDTEKSLSGKTIEINQPWAGFLDHTQLTETLPIARTWLNNFLLQLTHIGFTSFHFNLKNWEYNRVTLINEFCIKTNTEFSIYCNDYGKLTNINKFKGSRLKRFWLPYESKMENKMTKIRDLNIEVCFELEYGISLCKEDIKTINSADRLSFRQPCLLDRKSLRKIIYKFWSYKSRFAKRLLRISSMSELINFTRQAYTIIEILLINKGK